MLGFQSVAPDAVVNPTRYVPAGSEISVAAAGPAQIVAMSREEDFPMRAENRMRVGFLVPLASTRNRTSGVRGATRTFHMTVPFGLAVMGA